MITDTIHEHLSDIQSTKITSLITPVTLIEPSDVLSQVISKINKNNVYDVFCISDRKVLSTNIRALLNAKNITTMKVESFLYPIPHITKNDPIQRAANIITHYRIREVPVVEKNQIIGVVKAEQIIKLLSSKDNKWIKANMIYTPNPITISSDETLSSARRIMDTKRIIIKLPK
jgi:CBS domain-containing protein